MFAEEAAWIGKSLEHLDPSRSPVVANIGSSTAEFRESVQPHIDRRIFAPLRGRGFEIRHIDVKQAPGVDRVADVTTAAFASEFENAFDAVICTNLLEHVEDISAVARHLWTSCRHGGHLLITVPYRYKRHLDPIDNMFRPRPAEIRALFAPDAVREVTAAIITIDDAAAYALKKSRFPLWGHRERIGHRLGIRYKVSGTLLEVRKRS